MRTVLTNECPGKSRRDRPLRPKRHCVRGHAKFWTIISALQRRPSPNPVHSVRTPELLLLVCAISKRNSVPTPIKINSISRGMFIYIAESTATTWASTSPSTRKSPPTHSTSRWSSNPAEGTEISRVWTSRRGRVVSSTPNSL